MNFDWIAIFNGALGAGVISVLLKLIDAYSNRNKTRADAAKVIVEGGAQAVKTMREILEDQDRINDEQAADIKELQLGKRERLKRIEDLESQVENLVYQNEELLGKQLLMEQKQLQDLNDYALAQKQIAKLEDMAIKTGEYVDRILTKAKEKGWDIPLNGELLDSVRRLRLSAEERRKLRGGQ